jgi:hypothetical protein
MVRLVTVPDTTWLYIRGSMQMVFYYHMIYSPETNNESKTLDYIHTRVHALLLPPVRYSDSSNKKDTGIVVTACSFRRKCCWLRHGKSLNTESEYICLRPGHGPLQESVFMCLCHSEILALRKLMLPSVFWHPSSRSGTGPKNAGQHRLIPVSDQFQ